MKEQFGNITLYNADCMDILRELPDKQFDLAIVDPPYFDGPNKLGYYGTSKSSKGGGLSVLSIRRSIGQFLETTTLKN